MTTATREEADLRRVSLVVALGAIMTVIDSTIVNVAVHVLGRDLGTSLDTIQWVLTGYLLALSMTIPITGWAIGRFGGRAVWLTALSLFIVGSVLCGAAWSAGSLIVFRVVQGVGGGLLMPAAQTILAQAAGPRRMARAMAVVSIPGMLAPMLGPVLGGLLLDHLSWRWMFLINVPVCAAALIMAVRLLPVTKPETKENAGLDVLGLMLLSPGLAILIWGLSGGGTAGKALGLLLLAAFVGHALRRRERALVDLRLFKGRAYATAIGVIFCYSIAMFGALLLIPLYAQQVRGGGVLEAGLLVAPVGAGAILTMTQAGRISARFGTRGPGITGILLVAGGLLAYTRMGAGTAWLVPLGAAFVMGLGHGLVTPLVMAGAYRDLARDAIPGASVAATILVRLGSALGAGVFAVVLQVLGRREDPATAFAHSFWWALGIVALSLLPALRMP
ncbi:DHA2 family efflux MFS transporter permease subunit [Actinoplanes sp. NPDC051411]|uniref:DHA2 family efflux MFS transporter permease subunit n=1 Tax=Actinoplanes sp. NPDC051411 TaxID=3155522 RepID=UPI0034222C7E